MRRAAVVKTRAPLTLSLSGYLKKAGASEREIYIGARELIARAFSLPSTQRALIADPSLSLDERRRGQRRKSCIDPAARAEQQHHREM